MLSRRDVAIRLDIPLEMVKRHELPVPMSDADVDALLADPPPWLAQSQANRTGKPVWATLTCVVCGFTEVERPKKWWPEATYLVCDDHDLDALPEPASGLHRSEVYGVGSRFIAVVDARP